MLSGNNGKVIWFDECSEITETDLKRLREKQQTIERELNKAAEAGLFLTAADLNE